MNAQETVGTRVGEHLRAYGAAYLLVALHFGPLAPVAIVLSCGWLFAHVVWRRHVDLYLVFLLMVPTIVFTTTDITAEDAVVAPSFFDYLSTVLFLGPIALSTRLVFSLAVFTRVLLRPAQVRLRGLTAGWYIAVALSAVGLAMAAASGTKNSAGLTVGLRIALSVGAVLVPRCVEDRAAFFRAIDRIVYLSMVLLVLGFSPGHWMFIAYGLVPYAWFRVRPRILALVPVAYAVKTIAFQSSTLTIVGTILLSTVFVMLLGMSRGTRRILGTKGVMLLGIVLPIVLTVIVLRLPVLEQFDITSLRGYAQFKLLGDRKPIWDASLDQILHSSPFIVPAGSSMDVYFAFLGRTEIWEAGSHNIFLEIGRQIGAFGMVTLCLTMVVMLYKTGKQMRERNELVLFYCFLAIYIVFGITGNSLVYDGVGALFWFIVGQLYQTAPSRRSASHAPPAAGGESVSPLAAA